VNSLSTQEPPARAQPKRTRFSFDSIASHSAKYRPDVDGLRAIAVLGVLFFHLGFGAFQGGFVGVDIFYVISGYLITSLLVRDIAERRFSIVAFYERRARRIFPALFFVLFFCILFASAVFNPIEMAGFGKMLLSTTFFVSNLYFWHNSHPLGYFDRDLDSKPLLHTWSLSVEEQFYLLFPFILFLLFRFAKGRVRVYLVAIAVASFALNLWATSHKPVIAFYWFMPRAWELLIGALLAVKIVPSLQNRPLRELVAMLGLVLTVGSLFFPILHWPFPGLVVLLPCAGAFLIIYAGEAGPSIGRTLLSFRPLVFIGVISYSLYLWHWPIIVFSRHLPFQFGEQTRIAIVLISSIAFAFLSLEFVERPFRGTSSAFTRSQVFALGAAASCATAIFGAAASLTHGLPQRFDPATRQLVASNLERMDDFDESCSNWNKEIRRMADIRFCSLGAQSPHKIMFWGDSHVEQLYPALRDLYSQGGLADRGVLLAIENGCLPDPHLNNRGDGYHCDSFSKFAMMRAKQQDVDTVFVGFSTWWAIDESKWWGLDNNTSSSAGVNRFFCPSIEGKCVGYLSSSDLMRTYLSDLSAEIQELRASGKKVVVCLPFPLYEQSIPQVEISNAVFAGLGLSVEPKDVTSPVFREQLRTVALNGGAAIFDPRESLCHGLSCLTAIDGVSIYKDESHLTPRGIRFLAGSMRQTLQKNEEAAPSPKVRIEEPARNSPREWSGAPN